MVPPSSSSSPIPPSKRGYVRLLVYDDASNTPNPPPSTMHWCECKACGARLTVALPDNWRNKSDPGYDIWPGVLDATSSSREGRNKLARFAWLLALDKSYNRVTEAYTIYSDFCQQYAKNASVPEQVAK